MYYADRNDVIETDDYLRLHAHRLEKRDDGRVFSHQVVELRPDKEYTNDANLKLHVTNGAVHRFLLPEPEEEAYDSGKVIYTEDHSDELLKAEEDEKKAPRARKGDK